MGTIFTNFKNSNTSNSHGLLFNLSNKINLKKSDKYVALSNLSICTTWENMKTSYKNNKFKISAPTWIEEFELPDESYSVSNIQDYFEYIIKKHETFTDDYPITICKNKIENRIIFKIKTRYYLQFFTPEMMKLLGSTKIKELKMKMVKMCLI